VLGWASEAAADDWLRSGAGSWLQATVCGSHVTAGQCKILWGRWFVRNVGRCDCQVPPNATQSQHLLMQKTVYALCRCESSENINTHASEQ